MFTTEEKCELLGIAKDAIERVLLERPAATRLPREGLLVPRGAFVTIRIEGKLRGCVGYVESSKPLAEVVDEAAGKAAFEDPRFAPLNLAEYRRSSLEISILSELRPVSTTDEIRIGTHGVVLEAGPYRGLLLPQVALEYGMDRDGFLDAVARKAGLPGFSKVDPSGRLFVFEVETVKETDCVTNA